MTKLIFWIASLFLPALWAVCSCNPAVEPSSIQERIQQTRPQLIPDAYNVAFLIMDGVYNTELTAPFDIFQHTQYREGIKPMNVFLVANTDDLVQSFEGIRMLPDYNYITDSIPKIDILVVPSAEHHLDTDLKDSLMIAWVREVANEALYVTSHCDGAFVLAQAGLLKGVASTTFPSDIPRYQEMFPQLDVRKDVLFVHDDKFITSAGGAKSFEAALYLAEILYGPEVARRLAAGLVIDWNLESISHLVIEYEEPGYRYPDSHCYLISNGDSLTIPNGNFQGVSLI